MGVKKVLQLPSAPTKRRVRSLQLVARGTHVLLSAQHSVLGQGLGQYGPVKHMLRSLSSVSCLRTSICRLDVPFIWHMCWTRGRTC